MAEKQPSAEEKAQAQAKAKPLEAFNDAQLQALSVAGFDSLEALDKATDDELGSIPGVSEGTIKAFRKNQELRGVTPPSNDPPGEGTVVHRPPPVSDTVSHVDLNSSNPDHGRPLAEVAGDETLGVPEKCPECGGKLIPYMGDNIHKLGTAECVKCHGRYGAPRPVGV